MKTKLFGVLAIVIALSASAFTSAKNKPANTSLVWFSISGSIAPTSNVPKADATYMNTGATPTSSDGCPSSASYQCVSGFASSQVSGTQLKDNNESPSATPYEHN